MRTSEEAIADAEAEAEAEVAAALAAEEALNDHSAETTHLDMPKDAMALEPHTPSGDTIVTTRRSKRSDAIDSNTNSELSTESSDAEGESAAQASESCMAILGYKNFMKALFIQSPSRV